MRVCTPYRLGDTLLIVDISNIISVRLRLLCSHSMGFHSVTVPVPSLLSLPRRGIWAWHSITEFLRKFQFKLIEQVKSQEMVHGVLFYKSCGRMLTLQREISKIRSHLWVLIPSSKRKYWAQTASVNVESLEKPLLWWTRTFKMFIFKRF